MQSAQTKRERTKGMVREVVGRGVGRGAHPSVALQFLETLCRYDKVLASQPSLALQAVVSSPLPHFFINTSSLEPIIGF